MTAWQRLQDELDAWMADGRTATFWWRDDDATGPCEPLDGLLSLCGPDTPVCLAAIPEAASDALAERVASHPAVMVAVHGWAHANHAAPGEKKSEFPDSRRLEDMLADAGRGITRLRRLFDGRLVPVFVPPWNRMAAGLGASLASLGYRGVSTFGARRAARRHPALVTANCHVDPIDWRGTRGFAGLDAVIDQAVRHLRDRRLGAVDPSEPTGLMTHHRAADSETAGFTASFLTRTSAHPAARWLTAIAVFQGDP
jgi:hypothetical protein